MIYRIYTLRECARRLVPDEAERLVNGTREDAEARFEEREAAIRKRTPKERPAVLRLEGIGNGLRLKMRETDFRRSEPTERTEQAGREVREPYAA